MAQIFPPLTSLQLLHQPPTKGEIYLLNFLSDNLDDSYEVYFQPFVNGDRPDIIVMRPHSGILIIEVKDWDLQNYRINDRKQWELIQNNTIIKSPLDQVKKYKENLFDLHISQLLEKNIKNSKHFGMVKCAIYFHGCNYSDLFNFLTKNFQEDRQYLKYLSHYILLGTDSLNSKDFDTFKKKNFYSSTSSSLFDHELYKSFRRHLQPPIHTIEEGIHLEYTDTQTRLSISKKKSHQKICGSAGSGKTYILAKRAVNALKRLLSEGYTKSPTVLILTYNVTLKNYIHDRISDVREQFNWDKFYIANYHEFITSQLNNLSIEIDIASDFDDWDNNSKNDLFNSTYDNLSLLQNHKDKAEKFKVIFIDEIQDYKKEWVKIIRECFLSQDGEFIVFGDEKQNVYKRELDNDKKPYTGIRGEWNKLDKSFRLSSDIADLASSFQLQFLDKRYEFEKVNSAYQAELFNHSSSIDFVYFAGFDTLEISKYIHDMCNQYSIHPNDTCILGSQIDGLRDVDKSLRLTLGYNTSTMFETEEIYIKVLFDIYKDCNELNSLKQKFNSLITSQRRGQDNNLKLINLYCHSRYYLVYPKAKQFVDEFLIENNIQYEVLEEVSLETSKIISQLLKKGDRKNRFNSSINKVRKNKKFNFWMNSGKIKLSTMYSFKGWEINTLFLILSSDLNSNDPSVNDELIYTALTRCKSRLFILDTGNERYSDFFSGEILKYYR